MKKYAILFAIAFLAISSICLAQTCSDPAGSIKTDPTKLVFGNVNIGSSKTLTFIVTNPIQGTDVSITGFDTANSRFQITNAPNVPICLVSGQSLELEVTFTPLQAIRLVSHVGVQNSGGKVIVLTDGTGVDTGGGGNVKASPSSVDFGKVPLGERDDKTFSLINQGSSSVTIDKISSDNSAFSVTSPHFPKSISAGGREDVTVRFEPAKIGGVHGNLSVVSGKSTLLKVAVSGEGSGSPHINVNPSHLDFGATDVGTFKDLNITISNSGNASLQVSFPSDPFVIFNPKGPATIDPGRNSTFKVKLIADTLGHISKSVNILSNDPKTPKAPVTLNANGVQGEFGFLNRTARSKIAPNPNSTSALQFIDFDRDGKTDLYLTGHDGNLMCKNSGGGIFTNSTNTNKLGNNGKDSRGVTWGDLDNDGDLDVFISNFNSPSTVLKNNNKNVFVPPSGGISPGLFASDVNTNATGGIFIDFNNDKLLDIFVLKDGESNQLFKNLGLFHFANVASQAGVAFKGPGRSVVAADFNDDGFPDLYVANFKRPNKLYINNKNETFRDASVSANVAFSGASRQVAAVDFDGDGDLDIFVVNSEGPSVLFKNLGNLKFQNVSGSAGLAGPKKGSSATWSDFNHDGRLDVILTQRPGENVLFKNNGNGRFIQVKNVDLSGSDNPSAVVNGDSDNDSDSDVAIGDEDSGANSGDSVYQNTGGGGNNFLVLTLQGTRSNATAIGAKVVVRAGALIQAQLVSAGDGKNQSSLPLNFGLGGATTAQVIIAWPSGLVETRDNVAANQKLKIVEPAN